MDKIEIYHKLLEISTSWDIAVPEVVHETHDEAILVGGSNGVYYLEECPCKNPDNKSCKCNKKTISGGGVLDDTNRCPCDDHSIDHCDCCITGGGSITSWGGIRILSVEF